jgi:hypothetical protein
MKSDKWTPTTDLDTRFAPRRKFWKLSDCHCWDVSVLLTPVIIATKIAWCCQSFWPNLVLFCQFCWMAIYFRCASFRPWSFNIWHSELIWVASCHWSFLKLNEDHNRFISYLIPIGILALSRNGGIQSHKCMTIHQDIPDSLKPIETLCFQRCARFSRWRSCELSWWFARFSYCLFENIRCHESNSKAIRCLLRRRPGDWFNSDGSSLSQPYYGPIPWTFLLVVDKIKTTCICDLKRGTVSQNNREGRESRVMHQTDVSILSLSCRCHKGVCWFVASSASWQSFWKANRWTTAWSGA